MIKDLLKTMTDINNDTVLKPIEKVLLSSLILYHNYSCGYSYPTYENLKISLSTNRKATVSKTLRSLEEKEYITIKKSRGNKNIYFINKYLYYIGETKLPQKNANEVNKKPIDSNGNIPLNNQIHVDDVIDAVVIEISNYTGFSKDESKKLLAAGNNDKARVINAFEYANSKKNAKNTFNYTMWAVNHRMKLVEINAEQEPRPLRFNNFKAREYDYEALERKLLGWDNCEEEVLQDNEYIKNA